MQPYIPELEGSYIDRFTEYITTSDHNFFKTMFKKHLVRSVACSTTDYVNRYCFTLISEKQSIGKSWFIRWLNPFDGAYYTESPLDANNKDSYLALAETFIYNMEELATAKWTDINKLKSILSLQYVNFRAPYARSAKSRPRATNFFASTNHSEFLVDTENTRWICIDIQGINFSYSKEVNALDLWREAYYLFQSDYDFELTKEEGQRLNDINLEHNVVNGEEEMIAKYLSPAPQGKGVFVSATEIMVYLKETMTPAEESAIKLHSNNVGKGMSKLGIVQMKESVKGKQKKGYWVYQLEQVPKSIDGLSNEQTNDYIDDSLPKKQEVIKQNEFDFLED